MHKSVMTFIDSHATKDNFYGKSVIEVGAYDVNGSPRTLITPLQPSVYISTDMRAGKGVDVVCDATYLTEYFGTNLFDVVISTEMLEHVEDWRLAVNNMKDILKPGGLLLLTTRSRGFPLHDYPGDFWRFQTEDFFQIFKDMGMPMIWEDLEAPGVFIEARHSNPKQTQVDLTAIDVWSMKNSEKT